MQIRVKTVKKLALSTVMVVSVLMTNGCVLVMPETETSVPSTVTPTNEIPSSGQLQGTLNLRYSIAGIVYESTLTMDGDSGKMLTIYFNPNSNSTEIVEQTMKVKPSAQGLILLGYNPVYPGTQIQYPNYSADNFLFRVNPNGSQEFMTCDDTGRCSPVEVIYQ